MLRYFWSIRALRVLSLLVLLFGFAAQTAPSFAASCIAAFQLYDMSGSPHLKNHQLVLSAHSLILDSNVVIALKKRGPDIEPGRLASRDIVGKLMKSGYTDLRITPTTAQETALTWGTDKPTVVFSQTIQSETVADREREEIMGVLEEFEVGRAKGEMDRRIITEVFLAKTDGSIPTFLSADKGIYYGLLRAKGIEPSKLENRAWDEFPDGFEVLIGKRAIRVIIIPPVHSD